MEWTSVRAQRAMKLIGVAIVVVVAAAIAYLAPGFARSHSQGTAPQTSPVPFAGQVVDASFGDSDHGAVLMIGEFGTYRTYVTSNGGRTWTQRSQGSILTTFFDPNHAIAIQNGLGFWATADAGRTWAFEALPVNPQGVGFTTSGNIPGALTFLDPAHGWWFGVEDTPARTVALWQTSDGGRTWKQLAATGIPSGETLSSPVFVDARRGAIVAWPLGLDAWPSILTTQDGGQTWRSVTVPKPTTPGTHLAPTRASGATLIAHGDRIVLSLDLLPAAAVMPSPGVGSGALELAVTGWSLASEDEGLTWTSWSAEPATTIAGIGVPVFDDGGRLDIPGSLPPEGAVKYVGGWWKRIYAQYLTSSSCPLWATPWVHKILQRLSELPQHFGGWQNQLLADSYGSFVLIDWPVAGADWFACGITSAMALILECESHQPHLLLEQLLAGYSLKAPLTDREREDSRLMFIHGRSGDMAATEVLALKRNVSAACHAALGVAIV